MAKLAIQQIEAAFTTTRDGGGVPNAAYFDAQLPKARALAQKLTNAEGSKPRKCGKPTCNRRTTSPGALKQLRGSASALRSDL
jgi:hypothetical protein